MIGVCSHPKAIFLTISTPAGKFRSTSHPGTLKSEEHCRANTGALKMPKQSTQSLVASLGLLLFVAPANLRAGESAFRVFKPAPGFVSEGRCYMDDCSVAKWINVSEVSKAPGSVELQLTLQGGDYPENKSIANVVWNKQPHFVKVICSYQKPSVNDVQLDVADPTGLPGVLESSGKLYFQACHSLSSWTPEIAAALGYKRSQGQADEDGAVPAVANSEAPDEWRQKTLWVDSTLTDLEGWWALDRNGCNDKQDNQYRWVLGRTDFDNKASPPRRVFGIGSPGHGYWGGGCDLNSGRRIQVGEYAFKTQCEQEGETYRGSYNIKILSKDSIRVSMMQNGQRQARTQTWVRCPRD